MVQEGGVNVSIGVKIREVRESKGVMQKFIEERMGQYSGWLSRIESGKQDVLAKELVVIAGLLYVEIECFFLPDDVSICDNENNKLV